VGWFVSAVDGPDHFRAAEHGSGWACVSRCRGRTVSSAFAQVPGVAAREIGDAIALDLLVSPDGKQKIVDYIQFTSAKQFLDASTPPADPPTAINTEEPKDFTLDDGPVITDFAGFILINGQKFQGLTWFDKKPGATMWFCFPGQGR
jgi:hypothetical protein